MVEIAKAAYDDWKGSPEERLDELEALVGADDESIHRVAEQVTAELSAGEPEPVREDLLTFLEQVPNRIRQSQRSPADPGGRTLRPGLRRSPPRAPDPVRPRSAPTVRGRFYFCGRPLGAGSSCSASVDSARSGGQACAPPIPRHRSR